MAATQIPLPGGVTDLALGTARFRVVVGADGGMATVDFAPRDVRDPSSQDEITITVRAPQAALSGL